MKCSICKSNHTTVFYRGKIRNGKYPNKLKNQVIYECKSCKSFFLNKVLNYKTKEYREITNESNEIKNLSFLSNELNNQLRFIEIDNLKNSDILDVGCGTGFLLDYLKKYSKSKSGVEKNKEFLKFLRKSGHIAYSDLQQLDKKYELITSFNVIEHVDNVISFIKSMYNLLKKNGTLIIETPNSNDILLDLVGDEFKSFYYRIQHRNYFNEKSLNNLMKLCGISNYSFSYSQKYGLNNLFNWVKYKEPGSMNKYEIKSELDELYKKMIENNKVADHIIIKINKF